MAVKFCFWYFWRALENAEGPSLKQQVLSNTPRQMQSQCCQNVPLAWFERRNFTQQKSLMQIFKRNATLERKIFI